MANMAHIVPPGAQSSYKDNMVLTHLNVAQRFTNPNSINKRIEEQRVQDGMRKKLIAEFEQIDDNRDGNITKGELVTFFRDRKGIEDELFYNQIVEEVFDQIDINRNGLISKEEFITHYLESRNQLIERREETMRNIVDHGRQRDEVVRKLQDAQINERQFMTSMGIRNDSKLKVHIVDAQNLEEGEHLVKVFQDQSYAETNVRFGNAPIWNEAIVFDISNPYQPVRIQLVNGRQELVLELELNLNDEKIRDYKEQGEEIWGWAQYDENGEGIESDAKIRLRCHFSYSDVNRFDSLLKEWNDFLEEDINTFNQIEEYLKSLTMPFGFLQQIKGAAAVGLADEDMEDLKEQNEGDTAYHQQEKQYEQQLDQTAKNIAASMGYRQVPWLGVTYFCLVIQMILAMLTQFHRKDFITMTVCALGFYFLTYNESTRRSQFRMLVLLIACSIVQDVLWFVFNRDTEDDDDDGGVERSVKTFSRKVSYLSFAWRILLALVLWKCSLDFVAIVKEKNVDRESLSLEKRVEQIIREHPYAMENEQF